MKKKKKDNDKIKKSVQTSSACGLFILYVIEHCLHLSHVLKKLVFRVSDQVRYKPGCAVTEDGWSLESLDLESRGIILSE